MTTATVTVQPEVMWSEAVVTIMEGGMATVAYGRSATGRRRQWRWVTRVTIAVEVTSPEATVVEVVAETMRVDGMIVGDDEGVTKVEWMLMEMITDGGGG